MWMQKKVFLIFISFLLILFVTGCPEKTPTEPEEEQTSTGGAIKINQSTQVISKDVGANGGSVVVSQQGSPLNGLTITIPQKGHTETRNYTVSYSNITSHSLGSNFNPITPLISIKNGGGYSSLPITVKIPIKKAKDEFAIAFLYNESSGKVEALPAVASDDSSITIATRHFALSSLSLGKGLQKKIDQTSVGNLVVTSLKESLLSGQTIISTGFTPGVDDWEFINYGSYIASGGHCAGQSITAMWYFYEKKLKGESNLFHKFDKVSNKEKPALLWQDNPLGYRFASTIQEDFDWSGWITKVNIQSYVPSLVWKTFIAAMLITGEPQFVIIKKSVTNEGHAMIVYKINVTEGKLYIADPNYPNNRGVDGTATIRTINYSNGKLGPYDSFLKAGDPGITFDQIAFFGKTANLDWAQISKRYNEIQTKAIGNDRFPKYNLLMKTPLEANFFNLQDGTIVKNDSLYMASKSTDALQYLSGTDNYQHFEIYDTTGTFKAVNNNKGIAFIKLKPGNNKFGVYVCGAQNSVATNYVDFQWVNINYYTVTIVPTILEGEPTKEYSVTALSKGTAPKGNAKYVWNFGDNTPSVTKTNDSTATHTYALEGTYVIKVELFENSSNKKLGEATSVATIAKQNELLQLLLKTNEVSNECNFTFALDNGADYNQSISETIYYGSSITWSGNTFTAKEVTEEPFNQVGFKSNYYQTITGTVSADTKTLLTFTYYYKSEIYTYFNLSSTHIEEISFVNLPQIRVPNEYGDDYFSYGLSPTNAMTNMTNIRWYWNDQWGEKTYRKERLKYFSDPVRIYLYTKE